MKTASKNASPAPVKQFFPSVFIQKSKNPVAFVTTEFFLVAGAGFEPTTFGL